MMQHDNGPFNEDYYMEEYFLFLKEKFGIKAVIETGTYHGKTTAWLADHFESVSTIEVIDTNHNIALDRLKGKKNVIAVLGSSAEKMGDVISIYDRHIYRDLMIFLDAHWYTNPVLDELEAIYQSGIQPILAIHDFKNPEDITMGYDTYPEQKIVYEWSWIKDKIEDIYDGDYHIHYNKVATGARRGCLFVIPGKERIEWPVL